MCQRGWKWAKSSDAATVGMVSIWKSSVAQWSLQSGAPSLGAQQTFPSFQLALHRAKSDPLLLQEVIWRVFEGWQSGDGAPALMAQQRVASFDGEVNTGDRLLLRFRDDDEPWLYQERVVVWSVEPTSQAWVRLCLDEDWEAHRMRIGGEAAMSPMSRCRRTATRGTSGLTT